MSEVVVEQEVEDPNAELPGRRRGLAKRFTEKTKFKVLPRQALKTANKLKENQRGTKRLITRKIQRKELHR